MLKYIPLEVRDCQGTLWAFYSKYQDNAFASFEGDLTALKLDDIAGFSYEETASLKRQTDIPQLDFCVVPINESSIQILKSRLSNRGVFGEKGVVIHTQIEVDNELIFIACDNFHDECTVVSQSVPKDFLSQLKDHGLLRGYGENEC